MRRAIKWILISLPFWVYGWIGLIDMPDQASHWYQLISSIKPYTAPPLIAWFLIVVSLLLTTWFGWLKNALYDHRAPSFAIDLKSAMFSEISWARIGVKNLTRKMLPKCAVRVSSWELPVFAELDTETRTLVNDSMHQHFAPRRLRWMDNGAEEFDLPADQVFYYVDFAVLEHEENRCKLAKGGPGWTGDLAFEITISSSDESAKILRKKLSAACDPGTCEIHGVPTRALYPITLHEVGDVPIKRLTQRILSLPPSEALSARP